MQVNEEEKKAIEIDLTLLHNVMNNFEDDLCEQMQEKVAEIKQFIEKQQDIINRIEKYAKGIDDKELLLIVKASNQINDLFYKCKKEGLLDE